MNDKNEKLEAARARFRRAVMAHDAAHTVASAASTVASRAERAYNDAKRELDVAGLELLNAEAE